MKKKYLPLIFLMLAALMLGCGSDKKADTPKESVTPSKEEVTVTEEVVTEEVVTEETSSEESSEAPSNEDGKTTIEISWDASTVTLRDDSSAFDVSSNDVVMPSVFVEGSNYEGGDPEINGDIYTFLYTIPDSNEYIHLIVEPNGPTNNCPLDTVEVKITHPDGTVETFSGADRMTRGQTGIWYIDVYEQGN